MGKKIFVIIIPLLLAILELFHPHGFGTDVYHKLMPQLKVWIFIHTVQLILFGCIALVLLLMIEKKQGWCANLTRVFIGIFVVAYTAFDAIAGLGTGMLINIGSTLSLEEQEFIQRVIQKFYFAPYFGGSHSWLSETASLAALLSIWGVAYNLYVNHYPRLPLILYVIAGPVLYFSHAFPYGPIAFALIGVANIMLTFPKNEQEGS